MIPSLTAATENRNERKQVSFARTVRPYESRIYRTALVLTKDARKAGALTKDTMVQAEQRIAELKSGANIGRLLSRVLLEEFVSRYGQGEKS